MPRREEVVAERMADAIVKRLTTRKIVEIKDEAGARGVVRHVLVDNILAEEKLEADARQLLLEHAKKIKESAADYRQLLGKVKENDLIVKELGAMPGVHVKAPDDLRPEVVRALTDESKLEQSIDGEVRKILGSYARPMPEGSREWEVLYQKTREEVFRKRFRL